MFTHIRVLTKSFCIPLLPMSALEQDVVIVSRIISNLTMLPEPPFPFFLLGHSYHPLRNQRLEETPCGELVCLQALLRYEIITFYLLLYGIKWILSSDSFPLLFHPCKKSPKSRSGYFAKIKKNFPIHSPFTSNLVRFF